MRAILLSTILLAPVLAEGAETLVLLPASGANVASSELAAATDVLRAQLERTGKYAVVMADLPVGEREPTPAEAVGAARAVGAPLAATLRVSRLGAVGLARYRSIATAAAPCRCTWTSCRRRAWTTSNLRCSASRRGSRRGAQRARWRRSTP